MGSGKVDNSAEVVVAMVLDEDGNTFGIRGLVVRISPKEMRVRLLKPISSSIANIYRWNQFVDVWLSLPEPLGRQRCRAILAGVASVSGGENRSLMLDLDFPEISPEQERALRDSNPMLVVF